MKTFLVHDVNKNNYGLVNPMIVSADIGRFRHEFCTADLNPLLCF